MQNFPNYYGYNNPNYYPNNINNQFIRDEIDRNMQQVQQMQQYQNSQYPQAPQVNQTFQLAPNVSGVKSKIVKDIEEVKSIFVDSIGIFVSPDFKKMWIKDAADIREFDTMEVIEIDEKDKTIIEMQQKLDEKDKDIFYMRQELEKLREEMHSNDADKSTGDDSKLYETTTKQKSASSSKSK